MISKQTCALGETSMKLCTEVDLEPNVKISDESKTVTKL